MIPYSGDLGYVFLAPPLLYKRHRGNIMKKNHKRSVVFIAASFLALVGTYNAVMINSNSSILSESNGQKRLDEILGIVITGRAPAVTRQWSKLHKVEPKVAVTVPVEKFESPANDSGDFRPDFNDQPQTSIQAELNLKLVDVSHPGKWLNELKNKQFNGSIVTNNGIIESLTASLPEGVKIDIAFSELTGNTFEYDLNGEIYQGLMYQVDQGSFMVTLSNGPLEGTRMRFAGEAMDAETQQIQTETYLAETHKVEVGTFGAETEQFIETENQEYVEAPAQEEVIQTANAETMETNSFNFNQQI